MTEAQRLRRAAIRTLWFLIALWWIHLLQTWFGWDLVSLGVYPREPSGLIGVVTGPLIHGSWSHLVANTLPIFILGTATLYGYRRSWPWAVLLIWVGSGIGVWLFARSNYHVGASGLTHGLMFFAFVAGMLRRDTRSIVLAMLVFFLYGGMIWGVFPTEKGVSFESHFFGGVMGVACAVIFRRSDPVPSKKRYSWEFEEAGEDPVIGDLWKHARGPEKPAPPDDERLH